MESYFHLSDSLNRIDSYKERKNDSSSKGFSCKGLSPRFISKPALEINSLLFTLEVREILAFFNRFMVEIHGNIHQDFPLIYLLFQVLSNFYINIM